MPLNLQVLRQSGLRGLMNRHDMIAFEASDIAIWRVVVVKVCRRACR